MAGIIFYYEPYEVDVWSGKRLDAWNYACKAAGDIDKAIIIDKTTYGTESFDKSMDIKIVSEMPEITGHVTQIVCPWDLNPSISLWDYDHKTDWYLFGPANGWQGKDIGTKVCVPQAGIGALHSVHVATAVMLHRYGVLN